MSSYEKLLPANEHCVVLKFGTLLCLHIEIVLTLFHRVSFNIIIILYSCTLFRSQLIKAYTPFCQIILLWIPIRWNFPCAFACVVVFFEHIGLFFPSIDSPYYWSLMFSPSSTGREIKKKFIVVHRDKAESLRRRRPEKMVTMKLNRFAGKMVRVMEKSKSRQQHSPCVCAYVRCTPTLALYSSRDDSATLIYYIDIQWPIPFGKNMCI